MLNSKFWHVCYLKAKSERVVQKKIEELQLDVFLPVVPGDRVTSPGHLRAKKFLPLFPGYIFVLIAPGYRHHVTAIREVYRFIKFKDEFAKVSDEEIKNLQLLVQNIKNDNEIFQELTFQKGRNAEVTQGPFKGMTGKMIRRHGKSRIVIEIKSINQSISIEVDAKDLSGHSA